MMKLFAILYIVIGGTLVLSSVLFWLSNKVQR